MQQNNQKSEKFISDFDDKIFFSCNLFLDLFIKVDANGDEINCLSSDSLLWEIYFTITI